MGQPLGEWVLGDNGKDLELRFKRRGGTPFDLTGAVITFYAYRVNRPVEITRSVTLTDAVNGVATVEDVTNGLVLGTDAFRTLKARAKVVQGTKTWWTEERDLRVAKAPA